MAKELKDKKLKIKKSKKPKKEKTNKKRVVTKQSVFNFIISCIIVGGIAIASVVIAFCLYIIFTVPEFTPDSLYNTEATVVYYKDGTELGKIGLENRVTKNYEDFPQVLVDALVATEDSRFFQHSGIDAARFLKATLGQVAGNSDAGGASTLSMQIAKKKINGDEASGIEGIIRKFKDIYMAVFKIEKNYTKEQIIEMYLNSWWFATGGTNFEGIFGAEQASQYFFGKSISDVSLPEAALLIGMCNNPYLYNPYNHPEATNTRKNTVLSLMNRHGYITEEEMKDAQSIHVKSLIKEQEVVSNQIENQVLMDYVRDEIKENEGIDIMYTSGYKIYTTFDKDIQQIINNLQNGAAAQFRDELVQIASVVTSVEDGSIVAIGPGRNYVAQGDNRATDSSRFRQQPGSTAKPIVDYGPLIEYNNASTGQMFMDYRYTYNNGTVLNNWDNGYHGVMTLKNALSASRNVTALQAFHQVNTDNIKEFLNNLGITEANWGDGEPFESMCVGGFTYGVTPLESSAAYAAFAREGYYIKPYAYSKIINTATDEVIEHKENKKRAMSKETAWMITDVLLQATREGVGGSINNNLRGSIASKSGTSNVDGNYAAQKGISVYATPDHWVNTYNKQYSISMWYGYDRKDLDANHYLTTPTGSGARGTFSAYLANNILTQNQAFEKPSSVVSVTIEANTLPTKRASEYTPSNKKYSAYFKQGTEPTETSQVYAKISAPSGGNGSVTDRTISLNWTSAKTPDAQNIDKVRKDLQNAMSFFKSRYSYSYGLFENQYIKLYQENLAGTLGTFGYQVYKKESNGSLTNLGWTQSNNFNYTAPSGGTYTFVIKSAYSNFKSNESNGIEIQVKVNQPDKLELQIVKNNTCVVKDSKINPKEYIKVLFNGNDVTANANITSNEDTSSLGNKQVKYSATYQGLESSANGTIIVKETCE